MRIVSQPRSNGCSGSRRASSVQCVSIERNAAQPWPLAASWQDGSNATLHSPGRWLLPGSAARAFARGGARSCLPRLCTGACAPSAGVHVAHGAPLALVSGRSRRAGRHRGWVRLNRSRTCYPGFARSPLSPSPPLHSVPALLRQVVRVLGHLLRSVWVALCGGGRRASRAKSTRVCDKPFLAIVPCFRFVLRPRGRNSLRFLCREVGA